jgi:hypothetical protein
MAQQGDFDSQATGCRQDAYPVITTLFSSHLKNASNAQ